MDPLLTLQSPIPLLPAASRFDLGVGAHQKNPIASEHPSPFPSSGWAADELLKLAFERKVVDSQGRVIGEPLDIQSALRDEIQAVADQLMDRPGYIQAAKPENQESFKVYEIEFLNCIFGLKNALREDSPPEIIGSAVAFLLGERFYVRYLIERFKLTEVEAIGYLEPALRTICKKPGDIDVRQYIHDKQLLQFLNPEKFNSFFSNRLTTLFKRTNQHIDPLIFLKCYFNKVAGVDTGDIRFGMARFGRFLDELALEYFVVDRIKRPFISFHKSLALTITPPGEMGGNPRIGIRSYADGVETALLQQSAFVFDAYDVNDVDWRGFLSVMAEMARCGFRTLNPHYIDGLWNNFAKANVDLNEKLLWAIDNHLLNRGESEDEKAELLSSFYMNLCVYMIDRGVMNEEMAAFLLYSSINPPEPLNHLKNLLLTPSASFQHRLAWFKIGLWVTFSEAVPKGALSMNYGKLCYRIVMPKTGAAVWVPVDLANAATLVKDSISLSLLSKMKFVTQKSASASPYSLAHFQEWMDLTGIRDLSVHLKSFRGSSIALKLALEIDLALIASGMETSLPTDWFKVLPRFFSEFPDEYRQTYFHTLLSGKEPTADALIELPALKTICSERDWMLHLAQSSHIDQALVGLDWVQKSQDPEIFYQLEGYVWDFLQKKFGIEADISHLPIALFALACSPQQKGFRLERNEEGHWQFCMGVNTTARKIPLSRTDLILTGIEFYRKANDSKMCDQILSRILPNEVPDEEAPPFLKEEREQLKLLARKWVLEKNDLGIKLLLMLYKQNPDDQETLAALLRHALAMEVEICDLPGVLFAIVCGAFDGPLQRSKEGHFIFSPGKIPLYHSDVIEKGLEHLEKDAKFLPDRIFESKKSLLTSDEKGSIEKFARKHLDQELGIRLFLMLMKMDKSQSMALELLKLYPQLHLLAPYALEHIGGVLSFRNDKGSHLLGKCNPNDLLQRTSALLCHPNKKCVELGEALVKQMDAKQQRVLWDYLGNLLVEHRIDAIPKMIELMHRLSIRPKTDHAFFIKWIDAIKATRNEKRMTALKNYLCQKHQMKNQKGKVLDWLTKAKQAVTQMTTEKPQLTLIEQYQKRVQELKKKCAELKNDEQFADYFLALDVPSTERESYRDLLKVRLNQIQVDLEMKFALYVKFRFDDGRKWIDVLNELMINDLYSKGLFLPLLANALSPENDYGSYLWKQPQEHARTAWIELVRHHLRLVKSNLYTELPRITSEMFDKIPPGVSSDTNEFNCLSLILEFRAIGTLVGHCPVETRVESVNQFISQCATWSEKELLNNRDELFFQYWQVNCFVWEQCGNRLVQAVLSNDPTGRKAVALAKMVGLLMLVRVESSLKTGMAALELLKGRPALRELFIAFINTLFLQTVYSVKGNILEFQPSLNSLFNECQYYQFPSPIDLARDSRLIFQTKTQLQVFRSLLEETEVNPRGFHSVAASAMPLLGWMNFLKQYLLPYNAKMSLASFYRMSDEQGHSGENTDELDFIRYTGLVFHCFKEQLTLKEFSEFIASYDASLLAKRISQSDHEMVKPWMIWINELRQRCLELQAQSVPEDVQVVEASKPPLELALEEIESGTFDGSQYEKWLGRLHELMAAVTLTEDEVLQKQLFDRLENAINRVLERVLEEPSANHLIRFFNRYYNNHTIQRLRLTDAQRHDTLMKRWTILTAMCANLQADDRDLQLNYFHDLKTVYIDLLKKRNFDLARRLVITEHFKTFLHTSMKSIDDLKVLQGIYRELEEKVPKENVLGDPVESFLEVALTMQYTLDEIPIKEVATEIIPLLKSKNKTELNLAFHWLGGLCRQLDGKKAGQLEPLLAAIFGNPRSPVKLHVEPWMIQMDSSEWLVRVIIHFKQIHDPQVRLAITEIFTQFVSHFDVIQSIPKVGHLRLYASFMNVVANAKSLFTLTKPPFNVSFDYDQAVKMILEEMLTVQFPIRAQLVKSVELDNYTFAEIIMKFSDMMIRAMKTAGYSTREEMEDKFKKVHQLYRDFYTRLCDLAIADQDRPFLEEALEVWKKIPPISRDEMTLHQETKRLLEDRLKHWKAYKMRNFLKRVEKAQFADDEKSLAFAKKASLCFKELLSSPTSICSNDELSLYLKHLIQFLTQRFQDKKAPGVILKHLLDALPQTDRLNFAPRSLNTVNLCINAPLSTFIKKAEDCCKVAATLYRYIHSMDPLVVDTGFYWLGSILSSEKDRQEALNILMFLFDPAPRKMCPSVKFEGTNPGEIRLEPWMIAHGLSRFLTKAPDEQRKPVQEAIQHLMQRYLSLYEQISDLPIQMQIRTYGAFYTCLSSPAICESELILDYQPYVDKAIRHIFELFLPSIKREDSSYSSRPIVTLGTRMIECLSIGTDSRDVSRSQAKSYFKQQFQFQDRIRNYALETKNRALAEGALAVVKQLNDEPQSYYCANKWDFNQGIAIHQMAIRTMRQ